MISEIKLDNSFPEGQYLIEGYSKPYRNDRNCKSRYFIKTSVHRDVRVLSRDKTSEKEVVSMFSLQSK